jgi:hypothetical protein
VARWEVELSIEVERGLDGLPPSRRARPAFYIQLLTERGPTLGFPHSSQLSGRLRELRIPIGKESRRVTYYFSGDRTAVLLTTFTKTRNDEANEVRRAIRAIQDHQEDAS